MYTSIPIQESVELINVREVNPNISSCEIKVLYIGDNRNGTNISKDVAAQMGAKLPGSPIVGYYNFEDKDFEQHNREIHLENDTFAIVDTTKAYGYIDSNAKIWFQKFEENGQIREYLMTEGQIWTGIYPESQRIIDKGNNQSMELSGVQGDWTKRDNSRDRVFIINEAIIDKLCILGENFEPCFEGAQIASTFALDQLGQLRRDIFSKLEQITKGGSENPMNTMVNEPENAIVENPAVVENEPAVFVKNDNENSKAKTNENNPSENNKNTEDNNAPKKNEGDNNEDDSAKKPAEDGNKKSEDDKKKYNLEDIVEYAQLKAEHDVLVTEFAALKQRNDELTAEIEPLKTFKLEAERKDKEDMINKFFMLSDEDRQDVRDNIDTYSLNDIEAKLSVIACRKKVNFDLDSGKDDSAPTSFNLNNIAEQEDTNALPDWVKAVKGI